MTKKKEASFWNSWVYVFVGFGIMILMGIFASIITKQSDSPTTTQFHAYNLTGATIDTTIVKEICRCSSNSSSYIGAEYCIRRGGQKITDEQWSEMVDGFYNDEFVKQILIYNCSTNGGELE